MIHVKIHGPAALNAAQMHSGGKLMQWERPRRMSTDVKSTMDRPRAVGVEEGGAARKEKTRQEEREMEKEREDGGGDRR